MTRRVLVVGAGFGGLSVARHLSRRRRRDQVAVTLVDQANHHTFQPLLYQVATSGLNPQDVAHGVRGIFHGRPNVRFRQGRVVGVDWEQRRVVLADGAALPFDRLVLAAGAVTADYGVPGVAEHAFPLKSLGDAVALRNHILRRFEDASADPSVVEQGGLTFVVAGGGPTGVELAGALAELTSMVLAHDYPEVDVGAVRIVLVEQAGSLLAGFSPRSGRYAHDRLVRMGVEVRLGSAIESVTGAEVRMADGTGLRARTLVWAAGVRAEPLGAALGVELGRGGRVLVGPDLRVPEHPEAYVIGDLAAVTDRAGGPHPQLAPVALQQGAYVADAVVREGAGEPLRPFRYRDKGIMATIGRNSAVAELPGRVRIRGFAAWVAWLWLHLVFLIGYRNRASVVLNWAWSYLTYDRGARAVFEPEPPQAVQEARPESPGTASGGG